MYNLNRIVNFSPPYLQWNPAVCCLLSALEHSSSLNIIFIKWKKIFKIWIFIKHVMFLHCPVVHWGKLEKTNWYVVLYLIEKTLFFKFPWSPRVSPDSGLTPYEESSQFSCWTAFSLAGWTIEYLNVNLNKDKILPPPIKQIMKDL